MANYNIGGNLPFSGGGKDYASAYNAALQMNSTNYNNILAGFQQTAQQNQQVQQGIQSGYNRLEGDVLGGIQGIDLAQRQAISDQYARDQGQASQQLINRGLGNSTVQSSVNRGLIYDREKANVALTGQTQGINAQYRSQLGLAGLEYQKYAAAQNSAQANQQLQWMNSVNAAYPNASAYAQMAMAKGQSGMGGGVGPGGMSYGGSVKSPLGSGSGSGSPYIQGWEYGSGQFGRGGARAPSPYGGAPQNIYPSQYPMDPADPFWSTPEGQGAGGGTMGVDNPPWWAEQDAQMAGQPQGDGAPTDSFEYY